VNLILDESCSSISRNPERRRKKTPKKNLLEFLRRELWEGTSRAHLVLPVALLLKHLKLTSCVQVQQHADP
jgi:hypothetical protein